MSAAELDRAPHRRIRHDVRDSVAAAGISLGGSVLVTALVWAAVKWVA